MSLSLSLLSRLEKKDYDDDDERVFAIRRNLDEDVVDGNSAW